MPYIIKKIELSDADSKFEAISSSLGDLKSWFPWAHDGYTMEECREWIINANTSWNNGKDYSFAIIDEDSSAYIGEVKILDVKRDYCEKNAAISYWVASGWHRKGAATSAIKQAAKYAFDELGLIRLSIMTELDNIPSQKTAESSGATYEGVLRNKWQFFDRIVNVKVYSLIPSDLSPR